MRAVCYEELAAAVAEQTAALTHPSSAMKQRLLVVRCGLRACGIRRQVQAMLLEREPVPKVHVLAAEHLDGGSAPDNGICLQGTYISRRHFRMDREPPDWVIRDAGARNGLFVNGERVSEHCLRDGDIIQAGSATLIFLRPDGAPTDAD